MTSRSFVVICVALIIIISSVMSQEECYKPQLFTNRATLDKYLRCLKAKLSPRYGKRTGTPVVEKPFPFLLGSPSDAYYSDLYRTLQFTSNK
ncbi:hypothetical protein WA026_018653 [Henosepilachna vigintioctopunctata]|uniref:Uncharacterized protein n=1 Tax=Henosepilachna vigintioctopunctata TaxID=420089 RepID=A0AAW1UC96_9CUCU